jgi:acyl-CoA thioesterase
MTTRFDRDTEVRPVGDGVYEGRIDRGWWIVRGPNGGYLAAILLRALAAAVGDPERAPRALTVHYTRPPAEGPVRIETRLERVGRTLTTATARMLQEGRLQALALAAFSTPRRGPELQHAVMPEVEPPEALPPLPAPVVSRPGAAPDEPFPLSLRERFEERWAIGVQPGTPGAAGRNRALAGGWIRLAEPRPLDAPLVAMLTDAWPPAVFSSVEPGALIGGVPTIDLTIHFRAPLPPPAAGERDWVLVAFQSREARQGFVEEDGEVWSRDGMLLAQSRQLALLG